MAELRVPNKIDDGYMPSVVIVGNTYKNLYVKGYTVGELMNLARVNENKKIADMDLDMLEEYLGRIFQCEEGYTIRDIYLCDLKFGLIYAMMLTDQEYKYSNIVECLKEEGGCGKEFIATITPRQFVIDTSKILTEAEIYGYKISPVTFGDYVDNLRHIQNEIQKEDDEIPEHYAIMGLVASLLKIDGKDFEDKLKLLVDEVPAKVALDIGNDDYVTKMDIIPEPVECTCPECGKTFFYVPSFDIRTLLPSL